MRRSTSTKVVRKVRRRGTRPVTLTAKQFKALIERHSFRVIDAAWICDCGERQGTYWGVRGVKGAPALLLKAFDQGLIPLEWFVEHVHREIP